MPAATTETVLDFETNIEDAVRTFLLTTPYFGAAHQILTPRTLLTTEAELETPRITVQLSVTGSGAQERQRTTDGLWYQAHKTGSLVITGVTRRDGSGQDIGAMRGKIRKAMLELSAAFDDTNMPYYYMFTVVESGTVNSAGEGNDELAAQITFAIEFFIRPTAFSSSLVLADSTGQTLVAYDFNYV